MALRQYFNKNSKQSKRVRYCGIALIGFDADYYPTDGVKGIAEEIAKAAKAELENLKTPIDKQLTAEKLNQIEIEVLCIPLPSADGFRKAFLRAMGLTE